MPSYSQYKRQISAVDGISWITVKGNHIPIKNGESKSGAVKRFFDKIKPSGSATRQKRIKYKGKEFEKVDGWGSLGFFYYHNGERQGSIDGKKVNGYYIVRTIETSRKGDNVGRCLVELAEKKFGKIEAKPSKTAEGFWRKVGYSPDKDGYWTKKRKAKGA